MSAEQQVIVVGAGPTGLLNALGLAQQGVVVTILERASALQNAPRAIVYHWATLDGLARLDLLDDARSAGFLKQDYAYRVHRTGEVIEYGLSALEGKVRYPHNLHLGQGALAAVILQRLETFANVRVLWGHEVTAVTQDDAGVDVTVRAGEQNRTLRADWLIGADGAGSRVRAESALGFDGMTWPERFVAANVRFPDDRPGWAQSTFYVDHVYGAIIAKIDESGEHGLWRYSYMEDDALPAGRPRSGCRNSSPMSSGRRSRSRPNSWRCRRTACTSAARPLTARAGYSSPGTRRTPQIPPAGSA